MHIIFALVYDFVMLQLESQAKWKALRISIHLTYLTESGIKQGIQRNGLYSNAVSAPYTVTVRHVYQHSSRLD